ncbi:hypothetical protein ACJX0J_037485, partial [Zea mays]
WLIGHLVACIFSFYFGLARVTEGTILIIVNGSGEGRWYSSFILLELVAENIPL